MITGMATVSVWEERTNWASLVPRGYCRAGVVGIGEPSAPVEIPRREILLGDATERLRG